MTAVILCPGKSLNAYTPDGADITIGVNRACAFVPCDWAAILDREVIERYADSFKGNPKWMTNQSSFDELARKDHPWSWKEHVIVDQLRREFWHTDQPDGVTVPWTLYSFTSALVTAAWLGATWVEIYGADWSGTHDYDGKQHDYPDKRNDERWDGERKLYGKVTNWMQSEKGITVTRHVGIG